jgi:phage terminase large subunit-like protein
MLSNTAVPKYYGEFRDAVLRGLIPISHEVSMEMERIDGWISNPEYYYDPVPVEAWIKFCENELTLTDGSSFKMLDSFKLWGEQLWGWYYFEKKRVYEPPANGSKIGGRYIYKSIKRRLVKIQYLIVGRGAAKTLYMEQNQAYGLVIDPDTTHQIAVAYTMNQADETLSPFRTAIIRAHGPLFKFLTEGSLQNTTGNVALRKKLCPTKKGIENFMTGSLLETLPMNIDKLQGWRSKYNTVDEWLSCPVRDNPITALQQGAVKTGDYVIIAASSEGTVRDGIGDTIKIELQKILRGEYKNDEVGIWWYKLDSVDEVGKPDMWIKANPNLGKTVSYEDYQKDKEKAENVPSMRNDILAKRFGIPTEGYTYFFTYDEILVHPRRSFWGMPCALGGDLSQGDDFCSFTCIFPLGNGSFGVKTRNYVSELSYRRLHEALRNKYDRFIEEDSLVVMDGAVLDVMAVYDDLDQWIIQNEFDVRAFGFDPYNAKEFVERWAKENTPFGITKVQQGVKTESVPLGELKKLAGERMLIFDQQIMTFTMGNCIALEDTNGNRKLYKKRREEKIDCVAAMLDAYVAYKINIESFD